MTATIAWDDLVETTFGGFLEEYAHAAAFTYTKHGVRHAVVEQADQTLHSDDATDRGELWIEIVYNTVDTSALGPLPKELRLKGELLRRLSRLRPPYPITARVNMLDDARLPQFADFWLPAPIARVGFPTEKAPFDQLLGIHGVKYVRDEIVDDRFTLDTAEGGMLTLALDLEFQAGLNQETPVAVLERARLIAQDFGLS